MTNRFLSPLLFSSLLLFIVFTPAIAPAIIATTTSGTCSPTKVKYLTSPTFSSSRSSTTFGNIPEAAVKFTQGGASASCVIVRFSAQTYAAGANAVLIRATIDDLAVAPSEIQYSGNDDAYAGSHSYDFIFSSVAPGSHTVHMQFRSATGAIVYVDPHTTVVLYAP